jgi:hypothetical protein
MFCNCKLQEVEDESDVADGGLAAAGKAACATRDDVLSVLSALLSMHLVLQQVCSIHYKLLHVNSHKAAYTASVLVEAFAFARHMRFRLV